MLKRFASERSANVFDDRFAIVVERDADGVEAHSCDPFVFQELLSPQTFTSDP